MYTKNDVEYDKKNDEFSVGRKRRFFTDAAGSVYERNGDHNDFFCSLNGRGVKTAIVEKLNAEY